MNKPNCYKCKHRKDLVFDAHSKCVNTKANVRGDRHGRKNGWFMWPMNFDPVWLEECDGFEKIQEAK